MYVDLGHLVGAFNHGVDLLAAALGANAAANADHCWPPAELADFFYDDARVWRAAASTATADALARCCLPSPPARLAAADVETYLQELRPHGGGAEFIPLDERVRAAARAGDEADAELPVRVFKVLYQYALVALGAAADEPIYFPKELYSQRFAPEQALQDVPYELGEPTEPVEEYADEAQWDEEEEEAWDAQAADAAMEEAPRKRRMREEERGTPDAKRSAQETVLPSATGATPTRRAGLAALVADEAEQTRDWVTRLTELLAEG